MYRPDRRDGLSKAGSGRVWTYRQTDLTYIYTLESNYNMSRYTNRVPSHSVLKPTGPQHGLKAGTAVRTADISSTLPPCQFCHPSTTARQCR